MRMCINYQRQLYVNNCEMNAYKGDKVMCCGQTAKDIRNP